MPRILRIINRFNLGGPTHNAAYLTKHLPGDYETLLVGGQWDESEEGSKHILDAIGVEPLILPEMRRDIAPWRDRTAYRRVKQLIKDFKPDIVHTHAAKAGAVGRMAASEMGVKVIVHTFHGHVFHSYFGQLRTTMYKNIERFLARRSTRIVAISERQRAELVDEHRICADNKVSVIPLGFDLSKFQQDLEAKRKLFRRVYGVADDEIAVGIVGRLVPVKNHDLFLQSMKHLSERTGKKVRAFIVGDGEERGRLEQVTRDLGPQHGGRPLLQRPWLRTRCERQALCPECPDHLHQLDQGSGCGERRVGHRGPDEQQRRHPGDPDRGPGGQQARGQHQCGWHRERGPQRPHRTTEPSRGCGQPCRQPAQSG